MNLPGLSALLSPLSVSDFFVSNWPKKPVSVHGAEKTAQSLRTLPFLHSLGSLLNSWPHEIQAHLPDLRDEASSIGATSLDAKKLFENHMGLLFNNVERISPLLKEWIDAIQADLGLPASTYGRCIVYATPDGKGTAPHFDQNINFVLQIHGTKKWRIARNDSVANPTQRHTLGQNLDPELASYAHDELPGAMPESAEEIILKPGSVLFLPRGYWHSTEAEGEALALNFTFSQPTWIDLFTLALRSRLSLSPDWRELADGVSSRDPEKRMTAEANLDQLLIELTADIPNWRASDILGATEGF